MSNFQRAAGFDNAGAIAYIVDIMGEGLGGFEQAVLLALVRLGAGAYGRTVLGEVEARLGRTVARGAVYATLERLEKKGMIRSRLEAGGEARGGRARRSYQVTGAGAEALNQARAALEQLWGGVSWPVAAPAGRRG